MKDTLFFRSSPDNTEDQIRTGQVELLKQGLMRYVLATPLAKHIKVSFDQPMSEEVTTDKWKNRVFGASVSGLSYTFGSIYNNVVNPRFGSNSGGMSIMFN